MECFTHLPFFFLPSSLPPSLQELRSGLHASQALGRARRKKEVACPGLSGKEGRREGGREGGRGGKDVDAWELSLCSGVVAVSGVYVFGRGRREGGREGGREGRGGRDGVSAGAGVSVGEGGWMEGGRERRKQ